MKLVSFQLDNLINGVSQQTSTVRRTSQAEEQINCVSSPLQGLKRRPPTEFLARLTADTFSSSFTHFISRGTGERYIMFALNGDLRVFDIQGNEKTVYFPDGVGYLDAANPDKDYAAITVADYTFLVNKNKVVSEGAASSPPRDPEALLNVVQGNYGKSYSVYADGIQIAEYTTPDGSEPGHVSNISTDFIAGQLYSDIANNGNYTASLHGSSVYFRRKDKADFSLKVKDGFNGNAMKGIKGTVQRFSDLPPGGPIGFVAEVAGDANSSFDNYFVKLTDSNNTTGTWKETVAPGITAGLDNTTMPHALVSNADGTFTFKQLDWGDRQAGDAESSPMPSFVGKALSEVFFYRNRLSFLSDESVVMSEAGNYFNFFPTTATTLVDSDPIDVSSNHTKISFLRHATPFNNTLITHSGETQFQVDGGQILSASTITMQPVSEYQMDTEVKPVVAGTSLYFVASRGNYGAIREYMQGQLENTYISADVTSHVPYYIPSPVRKLAVVSNEDFLVVLPESEPNALYVYRWTTIGNEKAQSSWSKWEFGGGDTVIDVSASDSYLYLTIQRADGVFLEALNMAEGASDEAVSHLVPLDRRVTLADCDVTYDSAQDRTEIRLPYVPDTSPTMLRDYSANTPEGEKGAEVPLTLISGDLFYADGDVSGYSAFIGVEYQSRYVFSPLYIRDGSKGSAILMPDFHLTRLMLSVEDTGQFDVSITPKGRDPYVGTFTGIVVDGVGQELGSAQIYSGKFSIPLTGKGGETRITLQSKGAHPFNISIAEIEGRLTSRNKVM